MAPPRQKPGKSQQDYETPPELIEAVLRLLGVEEFRMDLAADASNTKARNYIGVAGDSLSVEWGDLAEWEQPSWNQWCWLNPPFAHILPWARKCAESGIKVAFLVPASRGSIWYSEWVEPYCYVFDLKGRPSFDGKGPYPKDLMLCLYGTRFRGSSVWDWRKEVPRP